MEKTLVSCTVKNDFCRGTYWHVLARIGTFFVRSAKHQKIYQNWYPGPFSWDDEPTTHFLHTFGLAIIILILKLNLNFAVLKLLKLLADGDVESNPGPTTYDVLKVVQGSFHQGHPKFGQTAGIQCACNSLFTLCWSSIKRVAVWITSDLDHVLESGDCLYKSLNTNNILSVDDLPQNVTVEGCALRTTMLKNETGIMNITDHLDFLEQSYQKLSDTGNGLIFFINGYTFALIWSKSAVFLRDSHSRDEQGFTTPDGTSVLLKFRSLDDVQSYITNIYLVHQNMQITFYQLQYIKIETENIDIPLILMSVKRSRDRKRKQKLGTV